MHYRRVLARLRESCLRKLREAAAEDVEVTPCANWDAFELIVPGFEGVIAIDPPVRQSSAFVPRMDLNPAVKNVLERHRGPVVVFTSPERVSASLSLFSDHRTRLLLDTVDSTATIAVNSTSHLRIKRFSSLSTDSILTLRCSTKS